MIRYLVRRFIVRPLDQWSRPPELADVLPQVFEQVDREVPKLLALRASPVLVTGAIAAAIADATGNKATGDQVRAVVELYSPVAAALRGIR